MWPLIDIRTHLPASLRRRLRAVRAKLSIRTHGHFTYFNHNVYAPPGSIVLQRILREGIFEPEIVGVMEGLTRKNTFIIDVGANIGVMSLALLANQADIQCISIECSPSTLPYLRKTHRESRFSPRWQIIESAVSDKEGILYFYTAGANCGAYDGLTDTGRGGKTEQVQVSAKTLDNIWRDCGSPEVSLIKIDIEGGETCAILSARDLVEACRPSLIFEWNRENLAASGIEPERIFELGLPQYDIVALPSLIKPEPNTLHLHMLQTEMFAAIPK
jgi:FkbM family methyltransferase